MIDLNTAEIIDIELNPLDFITDNYPTTAEFVQALRDTLNKDGVKINLKDLSVNGKVVAEKMEKYLANKSISSSAQKEVLKNPASYYFYINDKDNFEDRSPKHFELGTFCHLAFLEPKLFDLVVIEPDASRASNEGCNTLVNFWENSIRSKYKYKGVADKKINSAVAMCDDAKVDMGKIAGVKYYIDCLKMVSGLTSVSEKNKLIIDLIKRNYYRYAGGIIPHILKGASFETSFYGTDNATGLKVKVRPDAFNIAENIGNNAVISLKTTSAQDLSKFVYDAGKYRYALSEGYYQRTMSEITGREFNVTIMIVLQTVAPYQVAVCQFAPEDLEHGKYQSRYALDLIKECELTGLYPGFEALAEKGNLGIINIAMPEWSKKIIHPTDLEN